MPRWILAVTELLGVFVACRDGPTALAAPMQAMVSADAARAAMDLLDDPLVHELVWAVDEHGNVARLRSAVVGMSRPATNPVDSLAPRYPHAKQIGHFAVRWRE